MELPVWMMLITFKHHFSTEISVRKKKIRKLKKLK